MINSMLKREVETVMARLPDTATLDDLLLALQALAPDEHRMLEQERDSASPLRRALNRALAQSEAGEGIAHETICQRFPQ